MVREEIRFLVDQSYLRVLCTRTQKEPVQVIASALGMLDWVAKENVNDRLVISADKRGENIKRLVPTW